MRRLLVSTLAVLALASPASADGGWVLWIMGGDSPWDSVSTFATLRHGASSSIETVA